MSCFNEKIGVEMYFCEGLSDGVTERKRAVFNLVLDLSDPKNKEILMALKQVPEIYDDFEPAHYDWNGAYDRAVLFFNLVKGLLKPGWLFYPCEVNNSLFWAMENIDTDPCVMKVLSPKETKRIVNTVH